MREFGSECSCLWLHKFSLDNFCCVQQALQHRFWLARRAPSPLTIPLTPVCSWSWSRHGISSTRLCAKGKDSIGEKVAFYAPFHIHMRQFVNLALAFKGLTHNRSHLLLCMRQYYLSFQAKPTIRKLLFH